MLAHGAFENHGLQLKWFAWGQKGQHRTFWFEWMFYRFVQPWAYGAPSEQRNSKSLAILGHWHVKRVFFLYMKLGPGDCSLAHYSLEWPWNWAWNEATVIYSSYSKLIRIQWRSHKSVCCEWLNDLKYIYTIFYFSCRSRFGSNLWATRVASLLCSYPAHIVEVVKAFFFCLMLLRSTRLLRSHSGIQCHRMGEAFRPKIGNFNQGKIMIIHVSPLTAPPTMGFWGALFLENPLFWGHWCYTHLAYTQTYHNHP